MSALNATPKLSLFPLLMLMFGIGEAARRLYVAILTTSVPGGSLRAAPRALERRLAPWKTPHGG